MDGIAFARILMSIIDIPDVSKSLDFLAFESRNFFWLFDYWRLLVPDCCCCSVIKGSEQTAVLMVLICSASASTFINADSY